MGINIVKQHHALVDKLGEVCGANLTALYPYAAFGQPAYNLGDAIKDISDALTFDYDQLTNPLPKVSDVISVLNGVDPEMFFQTRRLAIELLYGRLYATEEIVNYMSGELPAIIRDQIRGMMDWHTQHEQYKHDSAVYDQQYALYQRQCEEYKRQLQSESNQHRRQNLDIPINDKMDSDGTSDPSQLSSLPPSPPTLPHRPVIEMPKKMLAFHGHREILYAMAKFQGMDFNISWPGLPTRAIPAATTMFWELHTVEGDAGDGHSNENTGNDPGGNQYYSNGLFKPPTYVIRTFHWVPISEIKHMNRSASLVHSPDSQVGDWQDGVSGDEINEGLERDLKRDGFKQIKLGFCSAMDCPVEEFLAYIQDRFDQYGTLQTLCTKGKVQDNQHMHPSRWMGDDTVERGYAEVPATHDRHTSSSTSAPSPSPSATDTPTTSVSTADATSAETSVASNTIATADGSGAMSADEDATVYARRVLMSPSSALPRRLSPNRPHALSSGPADDYAIFIGACIVLVLTIVMSYISYAITTSTRRRGYASIQRESDATV